MRFAILFLTSSLLLSGCSSSNDSPEMSAEMSEDDGSVNEIDPNANTGQNEAIDASTDGEIDAVNESNDVDMADEVSGIVPPDPLIQNVTRINFDITVPEYQSNALQVRLQWGDKDIFASFVVDESWAVVDDFPTDTENELLVTFNDNNGAITLGSFEQTFRTGTNSSQSFQISSDQFDIERWDNDGDGASNFDELINGTDPQVANTSEAASQPPQASFELLQDKTFRISWQPSNGATFYRVLENPDGVSGFSQISTDLDFSTVVLDHRVALFARVNARYIVQACNNSGCADSQELIVSGTLDNAIGYFKASNPDAFDSFGEVVVLSGDGNTMAVSATPEASSASGVNNDQNDNSLAGAGAVYVFVRLNNVWEQQAYLKASNPGEQDRFGSSLSFSDNGSTLAVGAHFESSNATGINGNQDDNSAGRAGAVYVFIRNDTSWRQQAYVKASNTDSEDWFGETVSLSATGDTLVVGANREDSTASGVNGDQSINQGDINSGAVYVFIRDDENWRQQAYLKASNSGNSVDQLFGDAVSLSADGNLLVVGAPGENSAATGVNSDQSLFAADFSGAAYVFVRTGETWQQQAYLKPSNTGIQDLFGSALSLSADGDTLAVGAFQEDSAATGVGGNQSDNTATNAGAVYLFVRADEIWQQQAYIKGLTTDESDGFGESVSLSGDGSTLAVGAIGENNVALGINDTLTGVLAGASGAAYVFKRSPETWRQIAYVKASNTNQLDRFGKGVSLSTDANTLAVGAASENGATTGINGNQTDVSSDPFGAVYLY